MIAALLVVLVALAGWEALVRAGVVDALLLPAPTDIAQSLWDDRSLLGPDLAGDHRRGRCSGSRWRSSLGAALGARDAPLAGRARARCGRW